MYLSEFNHQAASEIKAFLQQCVHIPQWADHIIQQRPFLSAHDLYQYATQQAQHWSWSEILAALNTHPRIGENHAQQALSHQESKFSKQEQMLINKDQDVLNQIYKGNIAYEKRFGYIFLIKASGLKSDDILTALNYRLMNDAETEQRIVHQQLLEIALLRLTQEVQND